MNFETIIKKTDTYLYKKCQFDHVDFTSAVSILRHFAMILETSTCLTRREADWYLELADKILFEATSSDRIKRQETELICAYKNVYQLYCRYLTENYEIRCERNLREVLDLYIMKD